MKVCIGRPRTKRSGSDAYSVGSAAMREPSYCSTTLNPTVCGPARRLLENRASSVNCAATVDGSNNAAIIAADRDNNFMNARLVTGNWLA